MPGLVDHIVSIVGQVDNNLRIGADLLYRLVARIHNFGDGRPVLVALRHIGRGFRSRNIVRIGIREKETAIGLVTERHIGRIDAKSGQILHYLFCIVVGTVGQRSHLIASARLLHGLQPVGRHILPGTIAPVVAPVKRKLDIHTRLVGHFSQLQAVAFVLIAFGQAVSARIVRLSRIVRQADADKVHTITGKVVDDVLRHLFPGSTARAQSVTLLVGIASAKIKHIIEFGNIATLVEMERVGLRHLQIGHLHLVRTIGKQASQQRVAQGTHATHRHLQIRADRDSRRGHRIALALTKKEADAIGRRSRERSRNVVKTRGKVVEEAAGRKRFAFVQHHLVPVLVSLFLVGKAFKERGIGILA